MCVFVRVLELGELMLELELVSASVCHISFSCELLDSVRELNFILQTHTRKSCSSSHLSLPSLPSLFNTSDWRASAGARPARAQHVPCCSDAVECARPPHPPFADEHPLEPGEGERCLVQLMQRVRLLLASGVDYPCCLLAYLARTYSRSTTHKIFPHQPQNMHSHKQIHTRFLLLVSRCLSSASTGVKARVR